MGGASVARVGLERCGWDGCCRACCAGESENVEVTGVDVFDLPFGTLGCRSMVDVRAGVGTVLAVGVLEAKLGVSSRLGGMSAGVAVTESAWTSLSLISAVTVMDSVFALAASLRVDLGSSVGVDFSAIGDVLETSGLGLGETVNVRVLVFARFDVDDWGL